MILKLLFPIALLQVHFSIIHKRNSIIYFQYLLSHNLFWLFQISTKNLQIISFYYWNYLIITNICQVLHFFFLASNSILLFPMLSYPIFLNSIHILLIILHFFHFISQLKLPALCLNYLTIVILSCIAIILILIFFHSQ